MEGPQRRSRRRSAVENDERILDAACATAASVGLDALTVSGVAKAAGFTSGAMYSRYEYREELFADMWERRCGPALRRVVEETAGYRHRPVDPGRRRRLVEAAFLPPSEVRVAVEMCLLAHRIPELNEIIPDSVRRWLEELDLSPIGSTADRNVDLVLLAGALGQVVMQPFAAPLLPDSERAVALLEGVATEVPGPPPAPLAASQRLAFERDDPIRNDLLLAAQTVLARSGVHRATLTRIGRIARLAPATVYGHYANREELISDILRIAQRSNYDVEARLEAFGGLDGMAAGMSGWLQPEALVRRRLNQETLVAAWHDERIGAVYVEEELAAIGRVIASFPAGLLPVEALEFLQRVSLLAINGSAVLVEVLPEMADFDWRPAIDLMLRNLLTAPTSG